ncbi:MAG TPA: hypothetical protein DDZ89_17140, partial [Clostridiales bacterium]|nr:hypothetical protein [Clostridiales bacterium]
MPVLQSLQVKLIEKSTPDTDQNFNDIFLSITEKILLEKPGLVLDVSEGKLDKSALEKEIVRIIDSDLKKTVVLREDI